ncbi:SHOCT domain-containing protein [Streptomyces sp. NPDC054765]
MNGQWNLAYDYPVLGTFLTMLWIFLWIIWIFLLVRIVIDIFRDDSLGGWAKTGWLVFVLFLPFIGVFVYLAARGNAMGTREIQHVRARQQAFDSFSRQNSGTGPPSQADELAKLAEIRSRGDLTDAEFQRAKDRILH